MLIWGLWWIRWDISRVGVLHQLAMKTFTYFKDHRRTHPQIALFPLSSPSFCVWFIEHIFPFLLRMKFLSHLRLFAASCGTCLRVIWAARAKFSVCGDVTSARRRTLINVIQHQLLKFISPPTRPRLTAYMISVPTSLSFFFLELIRSVITHNFSQFSPYHPGVGYQFEASTKKRTQRSIQHSTRNFYLFPCPSNHLCSLSGHVWWTSNWWFR